MLTTLAKSDGREIPYQPESLHSHRNGSGRFLMCHSLMVLDAMFLKIALFGFFRIEENVNEQKEARAEI
ncbi:MAG: hypothetical protein STSR0009_14820 [Methanoregula sp.]